MSATLQVLVAILITGVGAYGMRALFIVALAQKKFPPLAMRALEYVAPAVMGALVMSMLITSDGQLVLGVPEIGGLASAALVAAKTRNHIYALVVAMTAYWTLGWMLIP